MLLSPKKLPKIPIDQTNNLPENSGIYLITDDASRVWYIGKATDMYIYSSVLLGR
jgi:excinuclease UvrABC nuclease subunit